MGSSITAPWFSRQPALAASIQVLNDGRDGVMMLQKDMFGSVSGASLQNH